MTHPMRRRLAHWSLAGVIGIAALVATTGCGGPEYRSLHRGQCLPVAAQVVGQREADPPTVDCSEPHRYEVYAVSTLDGPRTFPGEATVDEAAQHECYLQFESNVGYPAEELPPDVKVLYLQPSESSWNDEADRDVECLLVFDDDRKQRVLPENAATTSTTTVQEGTTT